MRRIAVLLLAIALAAALVLTASALPKLDGVDSGAEWRGAEMQVLVSGESNSGVTYGLVKYQLDEETHRLFLCFMYIDPAITQESTTAGVIVTVDGSAPITLSVGQAPVSPDDYRFSAEGAMTIDEQHGVTCELCIGVKEGFDAALPLTVRFLDAAGISSNQYAFSIQPPSAPQTAGGRSGGTGDTTATTKRKTATAAPSTTAARRSGGGNISYHYNYTAAKRTTAAPTREATTAAAKTTAAKATAPKTAKAKTTKAKTTKAKTTKPRTSRTAAADTQTGVREIVIVSEVYVTASTTALPPEAVGAFAKGRTYQTVAVAAAAVLLGALAVYAATGGRRSAGAPAPPQEDAQTEQDPD